MASLSSPTQDRTEKDASRQQATDAAGVRSDPAFGLLRLNSSPWLASFRVHLRRQAACRVGNATRWIGLKGFGCASSCFAPGISSASNRPHGDLASSARIRLSAGSRTLAQLFRRGSRGIRRNRVRPDSRVAFPRRTITVLGPNRPWHMRICCANIAAKASRPACLTGLCFLLALTLLPSAMSPRSSSISWRAGGRRSRHGTSTPCGQNRSTSCSPSSQSVTTFCHVKVVGYNNGVVHFGHRYPGKTVVSTVLCNRIVRTRADVIKADCGATIRKATDFLAANGQELYVLPNYSYVCLGTAFFIPIHGLRPPTYIDGRGDDRQGLCSTIRVADRFILATSDEPAFREHGLTHAASNLALSCGCGFASKPRPAILPSSKIWKDASSDAPARAPCKTPRPRTSRFANRRRRATRSRSANITKDHPFSPRPLGEGLK